MIILGIDPGTATTGFGVVQTTPKLNWVAHGTIDTPKNKPSHERLLLLEQGLIEIFDRYEPELVCVEKLYFFKNLKTALPVSEARGIVLLLVARNKVLLQELTPLQAKMAVTGYGKAQKTQVQHMVRKILELDDLPRPDDAADALALAIAVSGSPLHNLLMGQGGGG
jgi:crossover junction endodeoxyribonuclease RuvC